MRALLDTSVLLRRLGDPSRIRRSLLDDLEAPESVVWYSQVSLLETQIKLGIGKLRLDFPVEQVPELADRSGLTALPLSNAAIFTLAKLPAVHRDPFDFPDVIHVKMVAPTQVELPVADHWMRPQSRACHRQRRQPLTL